MILVYTSLPIGCFRGIEEEPYIEPDEIIDNDIPFGIRGVWLISRAKDGVALQ
jgi:hypothetical protein